MKNAQQQQAQNLYFQTDLNKSQIADMLGVNRRTVMLWVQQGNWDRLKLSSQHLPSMVVEKCYYMLNHYLDNLLSANATISTFGPKEASAINQLAASIKKISNRSAVNESMEMFSFFLEDVKRKDPDMADAIRPLIESYIAKRKDVNITDFLPAGFNEEGLVSFPEDDIMEQWLDEQEYEKMGEGVTVSASTCEPEQTANHDQSEFAGFDNSRRPEANNLNSMVVPEVPYRPTAKSSCAIPTERLPKSVEKQLTDYLKKGNKIPSVV